MTNNNTQYWFKGGRGSAKSSFISIMIILLMLKYPFAHAVILRRVQSSIEHTVFNQIGWAINQLQLNHLFKVRTHPMYYEYIPTGQRLKFYGLDKPDNVRSIKEVKGDTSITWFEEASNFRGMADIRNVLQTTNRGSHNMFWNFFSFNPPKRITNWVNTEVLQAQKGRIVKHTTYLDVPKEWLGEQIFLDAENLKASNELAYRNEYLGEATGSGGIVFDNLVGRTITEEDLKSVDFSYRGMDFGYIDPTTWVECHYDKNQRILYITDEILIKKTDAYTFYKILEDNKKLEPNILTYGDSASPLFINELYRLGVNIKSVSKGKNSRYYSYTWLAGLNKIVIDVKKCPNAYREFSMYELEMGQDGEYIQDFPDTNHDHIIDAVRYAVQNEWLKTAKGRK